MKKIINNRIFTIYVVIIIIMGANSCKHVTRNSEKNFISTRSIPATRGKILSDDGSVLATNIRKFEIRMDFDCPSFNHKAFYENLDSLSQGLSNLFLDKNQGEYKTLLLAGYEKKERYYLINNHLTPKQLALAYTLPFYRLGELQAGLVIEEKGKRAYPYSGLARRSIGSFHSGGKALVGLEGSFDDVLSGEPGLEKYEKYYDKEESCWKINKIESPDNKEVEHGLDVLTTINMEIQEVSDKHLREALLKTNADWGSVALMRVSSGDIKAIANLWTSVSGEYGEFYNYAIGQTLHPKDLFLPFSLMAALKDDLIEPGEISLQSSARIAGEIESLYNGKENEFIISLKDMGVFNKTMKEESSPYYKTPSDRLWSANSLLYTINGREVSLTPLQVLALYNSIANKGFYVKPKLVKAFFKDDKIVKQFINQIREISILSQNHQFILGMLSQNSTSHGTDTLDFLIKSTRITKGLKKEEVTEVCVGFFPADEPVYSIIVVVHNPAIIDKEKFIVEEIFYKIFKNLQPTKLQPKSG